MTTNKTSKIFIAIVILNLVGYILAILSFMPIDKIKYGLYIVPLNILLFIIAKKILKTKFNLFLYPYFIFNIIASFITIYCAINFKTPLTIHMLDAVANTNQNEAKEFLYVYLDFKPMIIVAIILFISFMIKINFNKFTPRYELITLLLCIAISVFFVVKKWDRIRYIPSISIIDTTINYIASMDTMNDGKNIQAFYEETFNKYADKFKQTGGVLPKNIIFIIGESLQRNYMGIYGFYLDTTPNLRELENSNNLIKFTDTIAPEYRTNIVLRQVLNFSNYETDKSSKWWQHLNIIDMAKIAKYCTYWLSNQEAYGNYANNIRPVATRSDILQYSSKFSNNFNAAKFDEILLDMLDDINSTNGMNFYLLHLMGSHTRFNQRYPENFAKFTPSDMQINLPEKKRKHMSDYANTVLYNDYVISEIFNKFKDDDTLIIYLSDHAEMIYEDEDKVGRYRLNRWVLEIPLIFIASDKFKELHSEIWLQIQNNKNRPFMSDDIIHTVADIMGLENLDEFDPHRSLARADFNASRARIIHTDKEVVDYNDLKGAKPYDWAYQDKK